jgi:hypothetical protein
MMKSHVPVAMTILIGIVAAAFQGRPTAAVQEPSGFTAACFASNLDTVTRTLAATSSIGGATTHGDQFLRSESRAGHHLSINGAIH